MKTNPKLYLLCLKFIARQTTIIPFTPFQLGGKGGGGVGSCDGIWQLSVSRRPNDLYKNRARAYCACSRCGEVCMDIFSLTLNYLFSFPSLWKTARKKGGTAAVPNGLLT